MDSWRAGAYHIHPGWRFERTVTRDHRFISSHGSTISSD